MIAHRISMSENVLLRGGLYSYGPLKCFQFYKVTSITNKEIERVKERAREQERGKKREK